MDDFITPQTIIYFVKLWYNYWDMIKYEFHKSREAKLL